MELSRAVVEGHRAAVKAIRLWLEGAVYQLDERDDAHVLLEWFDDDVPQEAAEAFIGALTDSLREQLTGPESELL